MKEEQKFLRLNIVTHKYVLMQPKYKNTSYDL